MIIVSFQSKIEYPKYPVVFHPYQLKSYFSLGQDHRYSKEFFERDAWCLRRDHDRNISLVIDHRHWDLMHSHDRSRNTKRRKYFMGFSSNWDSVLFDDRVENSEEEQATCWDIIESIHHSNGFPRFFLCKFHRIQVQVRWSLPKVSRSFVSLPEEHLYSVQRSNNLSHRWAR